MADASEKRLVPTHTLKFTRPLIPISTREMSFVTSLHDRQLTYLQSIQFQGMQTAEGHQFSYASLPEVGGPYDMDKSEVAMADRRLYIDGTNEAITQRVIQFRRINPPIAFPQMPEFTFADLTSVTTYAWKMRSETIVEEPSGAKRARVEIPAFGDAEAPVGKITLMLPLPMWEDINIAIHVAGGSAN